MPLHLFPLHCFSDDHSPAAHSLQGIDDRNNAPQLSSSERAVTENSSLFILDSQWLLLSLGLHMRALTPIKKGVVESTRIMWSGRLPQFSQKPSCSGAFWSEGPSWHKKQDVLLLRLHHRLVLHQLHSSLGLYYCFLMTEKIQLWLSTPVITAQSGPFKKNHITAFD